MNIENRIYFDNNATTPVAENILSKLSGWAGAWGNPSSIHWAGREPKNLLREGRRAIAQFVGADPLEVVFTGSGSEANNMAIKGVFWASRKEKNPKNHFLVSTVEHPSVLKTVCFLESQGAVVEKIPVRNGGEIDLVEYAKLLRPETALVSCMLANNETGAILPIKKMAKLAHEMGALFHTDAVQGLGKMLLNVKDLDVDLATFSGHKFYALKGTGFLYIKRGTFVESLIHGGGQERHRRAGTENALGIAALAEMCETKNLADKIQYTENLRDRFETLVLTKIPNLTVTGRDLKRVSNTSSIIVHGIEGESLLMNLDMEGFAVSTGSACSSGSPEPSPTLIAMGLSREEAQSSLRVSFGWQNKADEVDHFVNVLISVVERLREFRISDHASQGFDASIGANHV